MDLSGHINDLITVATEMKNQPGANKKALNKTVARLEEARLWAKEAAPAGKVTGPAPQQAVHGATSGCTCPMYPHATDPNCPVHKP